MTRKQQCFVYSFSCSVNARPPFSLVEAADLELGLKRDALGAVDGSSLEALLKGEPLERRSGVSDLRGPEDDTATVEPPATSTVTHTSSGRIRKVRLKGINHQNEPTFSLLKMNYFN